MEGKWIKFVEIGAKPGMKTKIFEVVTKDYLCTIGEIKWYGGFRRYSFFPKPDTVYENSCLRDIITFIDKLMDEREQEKNTRLAEMQNGTPLPEVIKLVTDQTE